MAYRKNGRWVVEDGDLVYWREDLDTQPEDYIEARVAFISDRFVFLTAGKYDPRWPLGIVPDVTKVWHILIGAANMHIVPREACWRVGGKVYYDWSNPPIIPAAYGKAG